MTNNKKATRLYLVAFIVIVCDILVIYKNQYN